MAEDILANSPSKLNLSRRQTAVLQGILYTASQMAELLKDSKEQITDANRAAFLNRRWSHLVVEFSKMLL